MTHQKSDIEVNQHACCCRKSGKSCGNLKVLDNISNQTPGSQGYRCKGRCITFEEYAKKHFRES